MTLSGVFYLASMLLWWWVGSFGFGIIVGIVTAGRSKGTGFLPWIVLLAVAIGISWSQLLSGRAGFWFDSALLLVAAYFLGCWAGSFIGQLFKGTERIVSTDIPALAGSARPTPVAPALETIKPYQWQALKQDGALTLTGFVPSAAIKTRIMAAAKALLPKLAVGDRLQMGAGAPEGLETFAGAAFGHLAKLDSGTASLVDTAYTLTGVAKSETAKAAVAKMVASLPAGFVLSRAEISLLGAPAGTSAKAPDPAAEPPSPIPAATPLVDPLVAIASQVEGTAAPSAALPKDTDKPEGLPEPRGKADDLKRIRGVGRQNEGRLNELGIWHFDQIGAWTAKEVAWVGHFLAFPGRIEREQWVAQAKSLAAGEDTDFSKRVAKGLVKTSSGGATVDAPLLVEPMPAPPPPDLDQPNGVVEPVVESVPMPVPDASMPLVVAPIGEASFRPSNALDAARNGKPDRLIYVNGVDAGTERKLNAAGIYHFDQLAQLSKDDLSALSTALGTPGKAIEDNWKGEAAMLAIGSDTDHSKAVKAAASSLSDVVPSKG